MSSSRLARPTSGHARTVAVLAASVLSAGTAVAALAGPATSAGAATSTPSGSVVLTVPTANHHGYRHGAVPRRTRDVAAVTALGSAPVAPGTQAAGTVVSKLLHYGGGLTAGGLTAAGVTTGQPQVYLVFMGSQWGVESTVAGQQTFTGDADGFAPALQRFYAGLGTGGETWSGVMTQYCDGAAFGATTCSPGDSSVPYPTGGVLSGIWYDNSTAATNEESANLTGNQLAAEAEAAATYFGNTDQASNRNTQYVIVSPTGTNPDGWMDPGTGYCAYHDDTHDPTITGGGPVAGPIVAFTNLPYVPDAGFSCGSDTVNGSAGILDGATEAASHEYAETLTDQFPESTPPGGWSDTSGAENGDLCAYVSAPAVGPMFNLVLADGTVAVQGTWSNRANSGRGACSDGAPITTFAPTIHSFTPVKAVAGSRVTITGTNLGGATSVTFAGTAAAITADTTTSVTVTVPAGAGNGVLAVTTPWGTASSTRAFDLAPSISSFAPTTVARGGTLTISGSGLGAAMRVTVGGRLATIASDTVSQIVVTVSTRAVSGSVTVATSFGSATVSGLTVS